jgi:PDDEXK-like domain of unknown function (DUF3799)
MNYHDLPQTSSSEVACFLADPITWYHHWVARDWPRTQATPAMQFGTAVHHMIEHGGPGSVVKEIPAEVLNEQGHCKGKAWTEWKAANPAEQYLKPGEPNPLAIIWQHLMANTWVRLIVENAAKEVEHFWHDDDLDIPCRCRFDAVLVDESHGKLIDWKTTTCDNERTFASDAYSRFYDVRLALYRKGFIDKYGVKPEIYIVAIENSGGYGVSVYRMPDEWMDDAEARLILTVDEMQNFDLAKHLDRGPVTLTQPRWAQLKFEEIT